MKQLVLRIFIYSGLAVILILTAWAVHHSAQDATWLSRQLYPYEAWHARNNFSCQGPAQDKLRPLLQAAARDAGSLASQLAYLSTDGRLTTCSSAARGETPGANSRFRYASLTKLLTAQAVLQAMQEADLPLDTRLSHFIGQASEAADTRWQQITINQLLTHSAGLDRLKTPDPMTAHGRTPWCPGNLDRLKTTKLDFDPGTGYAYSNLTYCLLGVVLEQLDITDFRSAMDNRLKLANYDIRFVDGPYLPDEVRYDFRHAGFYGDDYWRYLDFPALSSAAGLSGSANALVRLLRDLKQAGQLSVLPDALPEGCNPSQKRNCYGPALFPYQQDEQSPLLWVQQGYVFGVSSLAVLDNSGAMLVWLGNGKPAKGTGADVMLEHVYRQWNHLND